MKLGEGGIETYKKHEKHKKNLKHGFRHFFDVQMVKSQKKSQHHITVLRKVTLMAPTKSATNFRSLPRKTFRDAKTRPV